MSDLLADPEHYLASQVNGSAASVNAIKNLQMQIQQDQENITLKQNALDLNRQPERASICDIITCEGAVYV